MLASLNTWFIISVHSFIIMIDYDCKCILLLKINFAFEGNLSQTGLRLINIQRYILGNNCRECEFCQYWNGYLVFNDRNFFLVPFTWQRWIIFIKAGTRIHCFSLEDVSGRNVNMKIYIIWIEARLECWDSVAEVSVSGVRFPNTVPGMVWPDGRVYAAAIGGITHY